MKQIEIDLSDMILNGLDGIDFSTVETVTIYIPLPSVGSANSYIDICSDYIDASWAAERLAATGNAAHVTEEYITSTHRTRLNLILSNPKADFKERLYEVAPVFLEEKEDDNVDGLKALVDDIADYEEGLPEINPQLPELVDTYFMNLVFGAYYEWRSEDPEWYSEQLKKYPEHEVGFFRSAYSDRLGEVVIRRSIVG